MKELCVCVHAVFRAIVWTWAVSALICTKQPKTILLVNVEGMGYKRLSTILLTLYSLLANFSILLCLTPNDFTCQRGKPGL